MTTPTTPKKRTVDLICGAFDLNDRRKFEMKDANGDLLIELYFKPITRSDRIRAMAAAGTDDALKISTQMLCQMAELEDGTNAFALADASKLQRELPESILNEIELFLHGLAADGIIDDAKND